jgi:hypothetical protein
MLSLRRLAYRLTPGIALVLLCIGNYYNALRNEFAFDDFLAIVNNKDVMYSSNSSDRVEYALLWKHDIWGKDIGAVDSHRSYRPLLTTVFKLLVQLYGLDTRIFHITSLICHSVATLCVFKLSSVIFGKRNGFLSLGSALLFACHPVHVEAVAAVVNMAEAISLVFYITAYLIYFKSSREKCRDSSSYPHSLFLLLQKSFLIGWWFIFLTVAVLFKETSVTLCGVIVASSGIALLTTIKLSYLTDRKVSMTRSMRIQELDGKKEMQQKQKSTIFSILYFSIKEWSSHEFLWVLASFCGLLFYSLFRVILLNPKLSPFLVSNFQEIWRSIGNSCMFIFFTYATLAGLHYLFRE